MRIIGWENVFGFRARFDDQPNFLRMVAARIPKSIT